MECTRTPGKKKAIDLISADSSNTSHPQHTMTSVRKRKMARSSVKKNTKRVKDKKRNVKMTAHPVMQAHWDNKLTLEQNYKKLGLTVRLGKPAGGQEAEVKTLTEQRKEREGQEAKQAKPEDIANETDPEKIPEGEARLIRDPETNEVVQVIYGRMKAAPKTQETSQPSIIDELIEFNNRSAKAPKHKAPTPREVSWIEQLHEKYGDDYESMRWDKKLNPMFMTTGQLKKKMAQWKRTLKE
ncbi:putative nucleolar protein [Clavispora lusitaniae]|uniref:Nucleolar protein 16 n=2 Tax=Clavispora lusitaniae TaxID=36911 RepID=C4Y7K5_CLAL4|nr:uncharacterized protein CLUG_04183 [Clavispora lusitaniae ATCC 42720]KAF7581984.1 Ribosome biogenesis protein Nop16 family protein [Clavispora lusitaniae]EEQ40055.1 hypothetical protein CLUG_04183 [Clavispora lusitaniae ATCC 42720]QFZ29410.1 putative nucleolar protein [Clavispora lusitaniae]QFZ35073.1 putative nucleolar protein [Clavispora lusitaniae]QFZ40758.1 putative nucleolar protein [Clavispora lusitaniae]